MEIERVELTEVFVRPRKYAREILGILVAKDKDFYYWVDNATKKLHKFDKKNSNNFVLRQRHKGIIYMITNDINNKVYIGQTSGTIDDRYANHLASARDLNNHKPLYEDMRKFGVEHFKIEKIIDVICCANFDLTNVENHFIRFFNSQIPNGYNIRCSTYGNSFDRLWRYIFSIDLNKDNKFYDIVKKFIDDNFKMDNWNFYKNFDLSIIEEEDSMTNKNESITIEIKRKRPQEELKSTKITCAYNSYQQDREELEKKLIEQFKTKLKNILDQEMEYSQLNHK